MNFNGLHWFVACFEPLDRDCHSVVLRYRFFHENYLEAGVFEAKDPRACTSDFLAEVRALNWNPPQFADVVNDSAFRKLPAN